jgi:plastocyanin
MHALALQLAPIVAAEKSKVPFYIAGGLLVLWALTVSLGLGLRRPRFPDTPAGERAVIAISAILVLGAVSTAVLTSGGSPSARAASPLSGAQATPTTFAPNPAVPSSSSESTAAPAPSTSSASSAPPTITAAPAPVKGTAAPAPVTGGAASSLMLTADPTGLLSFNTKALSAKAGTVTITLRNTAQVEHNVTVAQGSTVLGGTPTFTGGNRSLTLNLKPGTYTFYCTVPGHRQAGMEGTLKVS